MVFGLFFFTFIEHKNFWQNAKLRCVFLLSSGSNQYLHRWQWTDRQTDRQREEWQPTNVWALDLKQWQAAVWLNVKADGCFIITVIIGGYTVVCWCETKILGRMFFFLFFQTLKNSCCFVSLQTRSEMKNPLDVFFLSESNGSLKGRNTRLPLCHSRT